MIELYSFTTPNGRKPAILLEELQVPYEAIKIHIGKDEQFSPEFVAINPNSKIPALRDTDADITVFESGAILIYLAEKFKSPLLPTEPAARAKVLSWLMFQMGGVGPMFGQLGHFHNAAPEEIPYAIARYEKESKRLLGVMEKQLSEFYYLAGPEYSIADIATYPWVTAVDYLKITLDEFPAVSAWVERLASRPAVEKGMNIFS
ncbi:MAG: glutathione S-transferase N-terminal domain-containing protein [Cyanobacteria bacterium P01_H01_bin.15]